MAPPARRALARRRDGCIVCDRWSDEMISLVDHGAIVCRPCVARLRRTVLATSPAALARLWPMSPCVRETRPGEASSVHADEALAGFRTGVAELVGVDDAECHFDLAVAYGEMGLVGDAIREAATALGERTPALILSRVLSWLFAPGRAHPDALLTVVRAARPVDRP